MGDDKRGLEIPARGVLRRRGAAALDDRCQRGGPQMAFRKSVVVQVAGAAAIGFGAFGAAQAQSIPAVQALSDAASIANVSLNVTSIYDSNSAETSPALAAQEHVALGEAIILPSATVSFAHPIGVDSVFLQGSGGYDFHLRNTYLNKERINVAGGGTLNFSQCQVAPTFGYNRQQTELQDLASPYTRNVTSVQSYQVAFNCTRTTGFSPTLTASYLTDSNNTSYASDFDVYTISGGLAYDQPALGRLVAFGEYQNVKFMNRGVSLSGSDVEDGYDLASAGLRILHDTGSRISLQAQVAYTEVDENLPGAPGFHGPTYQGQARYTLSDRLAFDASFQKAIQPSNYAGVTFVEDEVERIDGTYTIMDRGNLTIGASTDDRNYQGVNGLSPSFVDHERRNVVFVNSSWRLGRRFSLDINTRYEKRIATPAIYTWSGERTGLTLSANF